MMFSYRIWTEEFYYTGDAGREIIEQIHIGVQTRADRYEFTILFKKINDITGVKVEIFDDAFYCFNLCSNLFSALAALKINNDHEISKDELISILKSLGYVDKTERERPE